jgi:hypothetical protein
MIQRRGSKIKNDPRSSDFLPKETESQKISGKNENGAEVIGILIRF